MTPQEKKEDTARNVAAELKKKREELGEAEQNRRVRERMRIYQEQSLKDAEETRERERLEGLRRIERMELDEEENFGVVEDNDFVINGPSEAEMREMKESGSWGGSATNFVDVRIKDAERDFKKSGATRKVVLSSERVSELEKGGNDPAEKEEKEKKEEDQCTSYEEDEEDESEEEKEEIEKEKKRTRGAGK